MNGILVVNKPVGYTSRDVVNIVSKKFGTKKVGHTGTLDPMASGVLVLCIGKCLKLVELLACDEKEYEAKVILGYETDTLDLEGKIIREDNNLKDISKTFIKDTLARFVGNIVQEVPKYSAVSVKGKRLYEYARANIDVELPKREVCIKSLELISDISINSDNRYEFMIRCKVSKGTYIRSLVRDIGYSLGTCAVMGSLNRTVQGRFGIDNSCSLKDIDNGNYKLFDVLDVLDIERVYVDSNLEFKIRNGQVLDKFFNDEMAIIISNLGEVIAIYKEIENNKVKPFKMF